MIAIDLTTKNRIYNTLGPQAQWVQHRFGKRKYPDTDLTLSCVLDILKISNDTINFISVYGDPCCHPDFITIINNVPAGKSVVNTSLNFVDDQIINALNENHSYVVVPLFGINELCNSIALLSDWNIILNNLKKLTCGVCVEFYTFEHNIFQVDEITNLSKKLGFELKINKGAALHPDGFSPIVNESGEWLYDAYPCSTGQNIKWPQLCKTVRGYNSLVQFVKTINGKSILDNPGFYKISKMHTHNNMTSISVTGHVFPSFELHQIFSNALCPDWDLSFTKIVADDKMTIREEFKSLCSDLVEISNYLPNNKIQESNFLTILSNFANSNI